MLEIAICEYVEKIRLSSVIKFVFNVNGSVY